MADSLSKLKKMLQKSSEELSGIQKNGRKKSSEKVHSSPKPSESGSKSENNHNFERINLKNLLENLPEMFFVINLEGAFTYVNSRCSKLTGYSPDKLLTMSLFDLIVPEFHTRMREKLTSSQVSAEPFEMEITHAYGEQIIAQFSMAPISDDRGKIIGFEGIASDITLEKNIENQLLHAQKMEAIGTLAEGIAHDFNNLLTAILGNLEMAKIATPPDHRASHFLYTIEKAGIRAKDLVKQLLQFGKPDKTKKGVIDLNKMIEETIRFLRAVIPATIEIETNLCPESCPLEANPSIITQIITNLSLNARDAMPKGGKLSIKTKLVTVDEKYCKSHIDAKCGEFCLMKVSDTGKGISPHMIERIFEPFFTTGMRSSGSGLGLAVVYTMVKRMGGWLSVSSELGMGSEFCVYFPRTLEKLEKPIEDKLIIKGGTETILFAEDEEMILELGKEILQEIGYTVLSSRDTKETLSIFREREKEIDLIILDLTIPGEGGIFVLEEIRKVNVSIPIIIASGYPEEHYSIELIKKSTAFLPKPYTPVQMAELLRNILDKQSKIES